MFKHTNCQENGQKNKKASRSMTGRLPPRNISLSIEFKNPQNKDEKEQE